MSERWVWASQEQNGSMEGMFRGQARVQFGYKISVQSPVTTLNSLLYKSYN